MHNVNIIVKKNRFHNPRRGSLSGTCYILTDLVCVCVVTEQIKKDCQQVSTHGENPSLARQPPAWLSAECEDAHAPECMSSMYIQNVKTSLLFISQRSCLFSYIDASGAWPNKADSDLNCLQPLSLVGKVSSSSYST